MGEDEVLSVVEVRAVMFADVNVMRGPVELEVARGSAPKKRRRRKNVIWLNLPWCNSVTTDIGRKFLRLVNYSVPPGHQLHKIFNRRTIKVSHSTMPMVGLSAPRTPR